MYALYNLLYVILQDSDLMLFQIQNYGLPMNTVFLVYDKLPFTTYLPNMTCNEIPDFK